jgi:hypothetical protein
MVDEETPDEPQLPAELVERIEENRRHPERRRPRPERPARG